MTAEDNDCGVVIVTLKQAIALIKAAAPFVAMADEADAVELSGVVMDGQVVPMKAAEFYLQAECAALRTAIAALSNG